MSTENSNYWRILENLSVTKDVLINTLIRLTRTVLSPSTIMKTTRNMACGKFTLHFIKTGNLSFSMILFALIFVWYKYYTMNFITLNDTRQMKRSICFQRIEDSFMKAFKTIIEPHSSVMLLGVPYHNNFGDSIIWAGEEIALQKIHATIQYRCIHYKCNLSRIKDELRQNNRTVLTFHGGGNFGDIWRTEQTYRNTMLHNFTDYRTLIFPQSVYYKTDHHLYLDVDIHKQHPDLHIMARSKSSMITLQSYFSRNHLYLVPDVAFMIGPLNPMCRPIYDVLFIKRRDKENAVSREIEILILNKFKKSNISYKITDWRKMLQNSRKFNNQLLKLNDSTRPIHILNIANYFLSQGRVLVTDRLHAAILGLLIDRPVIYLENNYGKLFDTLSMLDQWSECHSLYLRPVRSPKDVHKYVIGYRQNSEIHPNVTCKFIASHSEGLLFDRLHNIPLF